MGIGTWLGIWYREMCLWFIFIDIIINANDELKTPKWMGAVKQIAFQLPRLLGFPGKSVKLKGENSILLTNWAPFS